jgi:3-oxoacyl-[acyl-carrier protein] reductase
MEIEGKAAIVTGGGTGVGRATAIRLAERGCSVLVNYSRSKAEAEEVAAEVERLGVKSLAFRADVAEDADCRAMVEAAAETFGRLDVLVNNAGTTTFIPHADLDAATADVWSRILQVNLVGPFQCTRAARDLLRADGGGEVVMTSSVAGLVGMGSSIPYCASKAALNNLTLTLARVLGPEIRVNAVAPGFIDGEWLREGFGDAFEAIKNGYAQKAALGTVTTPDGIAQAIVGLVTGPDLTTGHVFPADAGLMIGAG